MAPINWSQISWYDIAKDFAGPAITAFSTLVALYFGLHKKKPKLEIFVYKVKVNELDKFIPGKKPSNLDTVVEFSLLSEEIGWFKLRKIDYVCGTSRETFFTNNPKSKPLEGMTFSKLNSQIVLSPSSPMYKVYLDREEIINELNKQLDINIFGSIENQIKNAHIELLFETNSSNKNMNIKIK